MERDAKTMKRDPEARRAERREPVPHARNTRPRGNPKIDERDYALSKEKFERVLGR